MSLSTRSEHSVELPCPSPVIPTNWSMFESMPYSNEPLDRTRHACPVELAQIPAHLNTDPKLAEIVQWSLVYSLPESSSAEQPVTPPSPRQQISETHATDASRVEAIQATMPDLQMIYDDTISGESQGSESGGVSETFSRLLFKYSSLPTILRNGQATPKNQRVLLRKRQRPNTDMHIKGNETPQECTSCLERFPYLDTTVLTCNHVYCNTCLATLIMLSLQSESSFPPKCCRKEVSPRFALNVLDPTQRTKYQAKAAEFALPANKRWYCPNGNCAKWIHSVGIYQILTRSLKCPHCGTRVCLDCRGVAHSSRSQCPRDFGVQETLAMAKDKGWTRCFRCHAVVERISGCPHMTCKCGAHFCYICGRKWIRCNCTKKANAAARQALLRFQRERAQLNQAAIEQRALAVARQEAQERADGNGEVVAQAEGEQIATSEQQLQQGTESEQEEIARLLQEIAQEVQSRQQQNELRENELQHALRISLQDNLSLLTMTLQELIVQQHTNLNDRHKREEQSLSQKHKQNQDLERQKSDLLLKTMRSNIEKRRLSIEARQSSDMEALLFQQKTEESCRSDSTSQEDQKLSSELQSIRLQNENSRQALVTRHKSDFKNFTQGARSDLNDLLQAIEKKNLTLQKGHDEQISHLSTRITADRLWFDFVCQRRNELLRVHYALMLQDLSAGRDPVGLTGPIFFDRFQDVSINSIRKLCNPALEHTSARHLTEAETRGPPPPYCDSTSSSSSVMSFGSTRSTWLTAQEVNPDCLIERPETKPETQRAQLPPKTSHHEYILTIYPNTNNGDAYLTIKNGESSRSSIVPSSSSSRPISLTTNTTMMTTSPPTPLTPTTSDPASNRFSSYSTTSTSTDPAELGIPLLPGSPVPMTQLGTIRRKPLPTRRLVQEEEDQLDAVRCIT